MRRGEMAANGMWLGELGLRLSQTKPDERRELMHLVIRRIVYRGLSKPLSFEFFDGGAVNLPPEGSKLSNEWLRL